MKKFFGIFLFIIAIAIIGYWLFSKLFESKMENKDISKDNLSFYYTYPPKLEQGEKDTIWLSIKNNSADTISSLCIKFDFQNLIPIKSSIIQNSIVYPNEQISFTMPIKQLYYNVEDYSMDTLNSSSNRQLKNKADFCFEAIWYTKCDTIIKACETRNEINIFSPEVQKTKNWSAIFALIISILTIFQSIKSLGIKTLTQYIFRPRERYSSTEKLDFSWNDILNEKKKQKMLKKRLADILKHNWIEKAILKINYKKSKITISNNIEWLTITKMDNETDQLLIELSSNEKHTLVLNNNNNDNR